MVRPIIRPIQTIEQNGNEFWRLDGKLHRIDGPAIIHPNGYEAWYFMGKLHREDGPALIRPNRISEFYLEGEFIPEREYLTMNASKYPKLQVYQIIHA